MENASKAIMIAGGVLLAMIVISICMLALSNASENFNSAEQRRQAQQLQEEMVKFAPYVGTTPIYGSEVCNCMKRAQQYGISVSFEAGHPSYNITDFKDNPENKVLRFTGRMETDGNGNIIEIIFTQL